MSSPDPPEFAVFETDFGVRAGMFICFDVLFREASELVTHHNVTLAITSTWWFDELPSLYAVAEQQAWSLRHGVPLLAANIQKKPVGSLGSGIYAGIRGPLNYTYSPDGKAKLLVASLDETPVNPRWAGPGTAFSVCHVVMCYVVAGCDPGGAQQRWQTWQMPVLLRVTLQLDSVREPPWWYRGKAPAYGSLGGGFEPG